MTIVHFDHQVDAPGLFIASPARANDRNDAEAICEAAGRPGMHFVPVKSVTQQAQGIVLKVRETLIGQRTALINTVRGHAAEFGIIAGKGAGKIVPLLSVIEQEVAIPPGAREMFALLGQQIDAIDARIKDIDAKLITAHKASEISQRLITIPGVGPVTALTLAVEVDPAMFESDRHLAAWAGLTPKERGCRACARCLRVHTDPVVSGALRMRRFYVRPLFRTHGIGRKLVAQDSTAAISANSW